MNFLAVSSKTQQLCVSLSPSKDIQLRLLLGSQNGSHPAPFSLFALLSFLFSTHSQSEPVTKAPSPRLHTPGCVYSLSLQALRATSGFKAHFTHFRTVLDDALQESAIPRRSNRALVAYIFWDQQAADTL